MDSSNIGRRFPVTKSSINKENLVLVYPVQTAPMIRQSASLHITDQLRPTVPKPKHDRVAGRFPVESIVSIAALNMNEFG